MIGIQMIDRLEFMHNKNIIHRDIKPDNFAIGIDDKSHIVYIFDFGLAKKYRSSKTNKHKKYKKMEKLTGTARYASINALNGYEQSRRDDLESVGYVLMYFLRGRLPWQGLPVQKGEDKIKKMYHKKKETSIEELCKGYPIEFKNYIEYIHKLEFEADPDYKYLRGLLFSVMDKHNCKFDFKYSWVTTEELNITDYISVERYIKKNTNISFELQNQTNSNQTNNDEIKSENSNNLNEDENVIEKPEPIKTEETGIDNPIKEPTEDNKNEQNDHTQKKEKHKKDKKNCLIW